MGRDCVGAAVEAQAAQLEPGQVLLLENLRFRPEEEANDPGFAAALAALAQIYVNDAFGAAHRAHASTEGIVHHLPVAVSGFLMEKEIQYLYDAVSAPERPFVTILGGAKVSGKIDVIEHLLDKVDALIIGGGMAYTFFKAKGLEIGNSLLEKERIEVAAQVLQRAQTLGVELLLPVDCVVADRFDAEAQTRVVAAEAMPPGWEGVDIGPQSCRLFADTISRARTVIWNGPLGVFEMAPFAAGTLAVAQALGHVTTEAGAVSIIGGGDTAAAIVQAGLQDQMTHISTGGGASLECLAGNVLPGVAALDEVEG